MSCSADVLGYSEKSYESRKQMIQGRYYIVSYGHSHIYAICDLPFLNIVT